MCMHIHKSASTSESVFSRLLCQRVKYVSFKATVQVVRLTGHVNRHKSKPKDVPNVCICPVLCGKTSRGHFMLLVLERSRALSQKPLMRSCKTNGKDQSANVSIFLRFKGRHLSLLPCSSCRLWQGFSMLWSCRKLSNKCFLLILPSSACTGAHCFQEVATALTYHWPFQPLLYSFDQIKLIF